MRMTADPTPLGGAVTLSIVVPVYNEMHTIGRMLLGITRALPAVPKQIIIVDDCSSDGTSEWLRENLARPEGVWRRLSLDDASKLHLSAEGPPSEGGFSFTVLFHQRNRGKGAAVRTGFAHVSGDVIVIQDADLEYDPNDWSRMLPLITDRKVADVVYGSRFYGQPHRSLYYHHYLGNRLISFLFNLLYNQTLSDIEVCYKMFTSEVLKSLRLTSDKFDFEIEISAQIARAKRWRIYEVGISYYGRTYAAGKKLRWVDGAKALLYLFYFRMRAQ
ncbi:MAG: glycosyltransferase family 2 protein [Alloacidobacterium sp.]